LVDVSPIDKLYAVFPEVLLLAVIPARPPRSCIVRAAAKENRKMAETVSNRSKSNTPVPQRAPARNASSASGKGQRLWVRYWKQMRPNKVYPLEISTSGRGDGLPVTLRVVMAGAQVVPAEQTLDVANPRDKVTFYVTPLAKGKLRAECVEVLQDGAKIQEIRIPSKVCTQNRTLVWLALSLLIPWLILHYFVYSPVGFQAPLELDGTEKYVRHPWKDYAKGAEGADPRADRITHFVTDNTPDIKPLVGNNQDILDQYEDARAFPENAYIHLFRLYRDLGQPIALYVFLFFLLIAFISFAWRQEGRKTVYSKALPSSAE
jgi:hypothetical protein